MERINPPLRHLLIIGMSAEEKPYIHGYVSKNERDGVFENYVDTGQLVLYDENIDVSETFKPLFVTRAESFDGAINTKLKGTNSHE